LLDVTFATWTDQEMDSYENSCVNKLNIKNNSWKKHSLCGCVGDKLEATFSTFNEVEKFYQNNPQKYDSIVKKFAIQCAEEIDQEINH
jgi:hypothetical protein